MTADADRRLSDLEHRVVALEQRIGERDVGGRGTGGAAASGAGTVRYSGEVALHGEIAWTVEYDVAATLALDDEPRTAVLAALGHPVRVRIVRGLLHGPRGTAELTEVAELASTGQLYHHLKALTHAGLVEQDGRGSYRIAPRAVVPALVLLTAAADIGGQLGTG
ncbi:ArsR/SmtB family transcription factor [Pseudonocardia parietis]|uniref:DNA-binding transcriptional ArsR family regulator n=1 Tax=Pseudonocardia parietis TaxID=570936 RepID=A0ABS4VTC9_9PSEU|nr:helix-turn-helix domain-containing protein [Pseudonocardia parietis]MBP2367182.1 DNA-binding transcriptional ArsR family regulator [Pseudonocardia parietis]